MSDHTPQVIEVQFSKGYIATVDLEDADLALLRWTAAENSPTLVYGKRILKANGKQKSVYLHRIIMARIVGRALETRERVDHWDGNTLNNLRSNLRLSTPSQNATNQQRHKDNLSGYKGVRKGHHGAKWQAAICVNRKTYCLGSFDTPEHAHEAYKEAALKYHGEWARFE